MEQQTSAERRRRAMILEAQGERRSAVETAEGDKQSNIIRAQGEKQSQILEAQGDASRPCCALNQPSRWVNGAIIEKGMETLESIGEGESTTFVLPQELSSLVGRYGKHLTGSDLRVEDGQLDSLDFDQETQEMLGLDNITELIGEIDEGRNWISIGHPAVAEICSRDSISSTRASSLNSSRSSTKVSRRRGQYR